MTKFNYKQAEAELAQIITHQNGMLYVNGEARLICQGYFAKTVIYGATNIMEDTCASAQDAVAQEIERLAGLEAFGGEFVVIEPSLENAILAPSPAVEGSIMSKRNGFCSNSGWPIIAGTHHIVAGKSYNSWIRTDKI